MDCSHTKNRLNTYEPVMADDTHSHILSPQEDASAIEGSEPEVSGRPPIDLGAMLAKRPLVTALIGVAAGIVAINLLDLFTGRAKRRSELEQSALQQLRRAQRLEPFGDQLL
jgi:hypothetical protein